MFSSKLNRCTNIIQSCALCGTPDSHVHGLCESCHADLPWLVHACPCCALPLARQDSGPCPHCMQTPPMFHKVQAAFSYSFPISALIPAIKYQQQPVHLGWLSAVMGDFLRQRHEGPWPDALLPIPMHNLSLIHRGYNQAELLAHRLGALLQIPPFSSLKKTRRTPKQMALNLEARRTNLDGAFKLDAALPKHVALVDDVMTTGTTVSTVTELLLEQGCERVDVWVLARTPENR